MKKKEAIDKSLNYSIKDGTASAVTAGIGDNFISAFAVAMKATNFELGLLSALPTVFPGELIALKFMKNYSRKKIILWGVLLQAFFLIAIAALSFVFLKKAILAPILLIIFYTVYMGFGWFIVPAWSSWMKDLTEGRERGKYFALRNTITGLAGLIAALLAGLFLDAFNKIGLIFLGFTILFLCGALFRMVSRYYLKKKYEPKLKLKKKYYFSFWQFIKKASTNNYGRFAIFIALLNFVVAISGPFFTPYVLGDLHFSYIAFTIILIIIPTLTTLLLLKQWGKVTDIYGSVRTMRLFGLFICLVPFLWVISPSIYWLIIVQIVSGAVWAGFNLASGNFIYDAVTKQRMGLCSAYSSLLSGIGVCLGSILGGLIASLSINFMNIFLFIFLISGIGRMVVVYALLHKIVEVRSVSKERISLIGRYNFHSSTIKNILGIIELPLLWLNGEDKTSRK